MKLRLLAVGGVSLAAAIAVAYFFDVYWRDRRAGTLARKLALESGKPLLVVGSGTSTSSATGAKLWGSDIPGSVHCDLAADTTTACTPNTVCACDVQDLKAFHAKQFSVALASNVLRYVPDRARAMQELQRVADTVLVSDHRLPWVQIGAGPKFVLSGIRAA